MRAILRGCTEGADMYRENRGLPARQAGQIRCTRDGEPLQEEEKNTNLYARSHITLPGMSIRLALGQTLPFKLSLANGRTADI